ENSFLLSTALTAAVLALAGGAASLSPENKPHRHGASGGSNFPLQRYAGGKGRPPPALMGPGPGTGGGGGGGGGGGPPRLMSRADNPMPATPLNNQTLDRYRRLIPYMTFYIPSSNGDFGLPINQAYNYMPIRSQRPQESQQQHHHQHSQQSSKQQILSLQQYHRQPSPQQSGLGGDPPLVYQSYQPQIHQSSRYQSSSSGSSSSAGSSQGNSYKTILINNSPIKYEYSQRHQLAPSPSSSSSSSSSLSSSSSSSSGAPGSRDPNLALLYNPRPQLQQYHHQQHHQQQQLQSPPSKLYAIEIQPQATIPKPQPSIQPNGYSGSSGASGGNDGSDHIHLLAATPAPPVVSTRSPIKYQPAAVYKKYQINPFLQSNKLPGSFTPLAYSNGAPSVQQHIVQEEIPEEYEEKPLPRPTPSPTYTGPKLQTTYVYVKPSPEPNQLYYHEKPAKPSSSSGSYVTYKEKPTYLEDEEQIYKPKPIAKPSYEHELEVYKTLPKPITQPKPAYVDDEIVYKSPPKLISIHKPSYLEDPELYRPGAKPIPVPIPVAVDYSTPRTVPQRVEYTTSRPHPHSIPIETFTAYNPTGSTSAPPAVSTTAHPKYSVRHKSPHHKQSRGSTKAPPIRQHLTENLNPSDIRSPNPNYFDQYADYKAQVKQNYYSQANYIPISKPPKVTKLIPAHPVEDKPRPVYQHNKPRPATPTQIIDTASASGSTSLADLLKKLQDSNHLPKTLTPDNIDNSIRTLVKILNNLKASQQVHQQPEQDFTTPEEYDHHQPPTNVKAHPKPPKKPSSHHSSSSSSSDDDDSSSSYMPHHPELGPTPPGPNSGRPGIDYPNLSEIPETSFSCKEQRYKGFFGDPETNCQVWHYCDLNGGKASFLCPNGTIFSQVALTCDWWFNVKCSTTAQLYVLNERLYKYILPFTPKFPEDYSGPLVDKYLAIKFQEMEEKMQKQRAKGKPVVKPRPEIENDDLNGNKLEDNDDRYNQNQPHPVQYVTENSIDATAPSAASIVSATTPITLEDINAEYDRASGASIAPETEPSASGGTGPEAAARIAPIVVTAPSAPASSTGAEDDGSESGGVTALAEPMAPPQARYESRETPSAIRSPPRPNTMQALRAMGIEVKNDGTSGHLTPTHGYGE
ncbi:proteoglycan 4, partial [Aedes albopictus]|uniref:Chitin-binding type-2 domain-containing protein n=1 Tax=Aedes albopictus TaxID=7160 RepID=A0ABM1ZDR9_AEDAL